MTIIKKTPLAFGIILLAIVLWISDFESNVFTAEAATTKFTNLQCETFNPNYTIFSQCRLKLIRRGTVALNIYAKTVQPLTNLVLNADLYKKANGYKPFLFNNTVDFCQLMKNKVQNMPVKVLFTFISPYTNLNHTCPISHDLIVKDLVLAEEKFRLVPLPSGEYMMSMNFFVDNVQITALKIYFARVE